MWLSFIPDDSNLYPNDCYEVIRESSGNHFDPVEEQFYELLEILSDTSIIIILCDPQIFLFKYSENH